MQGSYPLHLLLYYSWNATGIPLVPKKKSRMAKVNFIENNKHGFSYLPCLNHGASLIACHPRVSIMRNMAEQMRMIDQFRDINRWLLRVARGGFRSPEALVPYNKTTLITRLMGPIWAHLGLTGPRCAPCWPHELCYLGTHLGVCCSVLTWCSQVPKIFSTDTPIVVEEVYFVMLMFAPYSPCVSDMWYVLLCHVGLYHRKSGLSNDSLG